MDISVTIVRYLATAVVVCLPAASTATAMGLTGDLTNDPAMVVEKYVSLDQRGARLTSQSYEAVKPYVTWRDEPVWERLVVIRDYAVSDDVTEWVIISGTEAIIPVTFHVLGSVPWETATFVPDPREEVLSLRVRAVDHYWKIVTPQFPPHVGRRRFMDFVKDARLREDNAARAAVLRVLRDDLEKAGR